MAGKVDGIAHEKDNITISGLRKASKEVIEGKLIVIYR